MLKRGPILIVGVVFIIVLLLVRPFAIGMVNENAMRREIDAMPTEMPLATSIETFDRGWFSSTVQLDLGIDPEYLATLAATGDPMVAMLAGLNLPVIVEIDHGPVLVEGGLGIGTAAVRAYVDPESEMNTMAETFLGMPYIFEFRGRSGFGTGFRYEGGIPAAEFALPDTSLRWTPLEFNGVLNGGRTFFAAELDNITLQSPFLSLIVDALAVDSDYTQAAEDTVPLGTGGFSIGRLTLTDPLLGAAPIFAASETRIEATVTDGRETGYIDTDLRYAMGSLTLEDEFEMTDATATLSVDRLDAAAIYELSQLGESLDVMLDPEQIMADLMALSDRIMAGAPTLTIDPLRFSMPEGDFNGTVRLELDPDALPTGSGAIMVDPLILMNAMSADIELTATKALAQRLTAYLVADQLPTAGPNGQPLPPDQLEAMIAAQSGMMLGMLAGQGILIDAGDDYTTALSYQNGQMLANGQPLGFGF